MREMEFRPWLIRFVNCRRNALKPTSGEGKRAYPGCPEIPTIKPAPDQPLIGSETFPGLLYLIAAIAIHLPASFASRPAVNERASKRLSHLPASFASRPAVNERASKRLSHLPASFASRPAVNERASKRLSHLPTKKCMIQGLARAARAMRAARMSAHTLAPPASRSAVFSKASMRRSSMSIRSSLGRSANLLNTPRQRQARNRSGRWNAFYHTRLICRIGRNGLRPKAPEQIVTRCEWRIRRRGHGPEICRPCDLCERRGGAAVNIPTRAFARGPAISGSGGKAAAIIIVICRKTLLIEVRDAAAGRAGVLRRKRIRAVRIAERRADRRQVGV